MVDVVLLHGAWCGPEMWRDTAAALEADGLSIVAPDLPAAELDAGVDAYVECVRAAVGSAPVGVVVGHSLSGILLEPVAAAFDVRHLVYLTGFVPQPGLRLRDQWRAGALRAGWRHAVTEEPDGRTAWTDLAAAREVLFHDCEPAVAAAAVRALRPQAWRLSEDVFAGRLRTPSTVVLAPHDRLLATPVLRAAAQAIQTASVVEVEGGHMPMVSRPDTVADIVRTAASVSRAP